MPEPDELAELFSFLDDDAIHLPPVKTRKYPEGKSYTVESPDAETGLRLQALAEVVRRQNSGQPVSPTDVRRLNMDDAEERDFQHQVLGATMDEMLEDGISMVLLQRITNYAFLFFAMGEDVANNAAREGLLKGGKVRIPAANRSARRAASRTSK